MHMTPYSNSKALLLKYPFSKHCSSVCWNRCCSVSHTLSQPAPVSAYLCAEIAAVSRTLSWPLPVSAHLYAETAAVSCTLWWPLPVSPHLCAEITAVSLMLSQPAPYVKFANGLNTKTVGWNISSFSVRMIGLPISWWYICHFSKCTLWFCRCNSPELGVQWRGTTFSQVFGFSFSCLRRLFLFCSSRCSSPDVNNKSKS